jgi:hypothetical protein
VNKERTSSPLLTPSILSGLDHRHTLCERTIVWGARSPTSITSRNTGLAHSKDPLIFVWAEAQQEDTNTPKANRRILDSGFPMTVIPALKVPCQLCDLSL